MKITKKRKTVEKFVLSALQNNTTIRFSSLVCVVCTHCSDFSKCTAHAFKCEARQHAKMK